MRRSRNSYIFKNIEIKGKELLKTRPIQPSCTNPTVMSRLQPPAADEEKAVRSGAPNYDYGTVWQPGEHIYAWSRTAMPSGTGAHFLTTNAIDATPNHWHNRYYGFPLRCLAIYE